MPLAENDVKSELSYAYLHAVAARAGCECDLAQRHSDNRGIDARLTAFGEFAPAPSLTAFDVWVQLKATSQQLQAHDRRLSFDLDVGQHNKLSITTAASPWLLVLLQLPPRPAEWLRCSPQALTLKRCAYWVSLYGAPTSANQHVRRIRVPQQNRFTPDALTRLLGRFAREETVPYDE